MSSLHVPLNEHNIKDKIITMEIEITKGCRYFPEFLGQAEQREILALVRQALTQAPLFQPVMPHTGKPFSVSMSNMGNVGWVSDRDEGYRYQDRHPATNKHWPILPAILLALWQKITNFEHPPDVCLINYYNAHARMGLHQDNDEHDLSAPILSISLGDRAIFRLGGLNRADPTRTFPLHSGDILVLEPPLRLAYHGIDRILARSSRLLGEGGRFNLTMRCVGKE